MAGEVKARETGGVGGRGVTNVYWSYALRDTYSSRFSGC